MRNWLNGEGGLLLYEIHSVPVKKSREFKRIFTKLKAEEQRRRNAAQLAYGTTLTPWLPQHLTREPMDRDAMMAFAALVGVAFIAVTAAVLCPVIAGGELGAPLGAAAIPGGTKYQIFRASLLFSH